MTDVLIGIVNGHPISDIDSLLIRRSFRKATCRGHPLPFSLGETGPNAFSRLAEHPPSRISQTVSGAFVILIRSSLEPARSFQAIEITQDIWVRFAEIVWFRPRSIKDCMTITILPIMSARSLVLPHGRCCVAARVPGVIIDGRVDCLVIQRARNGPRKQFKMPGRCVHDAQCPGEPNSLDHRTIVACIAGFAPIPKSHQQRFVVPHGSRTGDSAPADRYGQPQHPNNG